MYVDIYVIKIKPFTKISPLKKVVFFNYRSDRNGSSNVLY